MKDRKPHMISELYGKYSGTCFLVGSGLSRNFYNINTLAEYGKIAACNDGWKHHHCDLCGARDLKAVRAMLPFKGIKFVLWRQWDKGLNDDVVAAWDTLFRFSTNKEMGNSVFDPDHQGNKRDPKDVVEWGLSCSSGSIMLQIIQRLGFNRIILIGMDGCALPGNNTASYHRPNEEGKLKRLRIETPDGAVVRTAKYLHNFSLDNQMYCNQAIGRGIEVFKLGRFGVLDLPVLEPADLLPQETAESAGGRSSLIERPRQNPASR